MKKSILLILVLLNIGCADKYPKVFDKDDSLIYLTNKQNDAEFERYRADFESIIEFDTKTPIRFLAEGEALSAGKVAVCILPTRLIIVKKERWDQMSETKKSILVIHELGHCDFGLNHVENDPTNIMYPSITGNQIDLYNIDKESLIEDMFLEGESIYENNKVTSHSSCEH